MDKTYMSRYHDCISKLTTVPLPDVDDSLSIQSIKYDAKYAAVTPQPGTILYRGISLERDRSFYGVRSFRWFSTPETALAYAMIRLSDYFDVHVHCVQVRQDLNLFPLMDHDALLGFTSNSNFKDIAQIVKFDMEMPDDSSLRVNDAYHIKLPPNDRLTYIGNAKELLNRVSHDNNDMMAASTIIGAGYDGWYSKEIPRVNDYFPSEILLDTNLKLKSFYIKVTRAMTANEVIVIAENAYSTAGARDDFINITSDKTACEMVRKKASKMKPRGHVIIPKDLQWR